MIEKRWFSLTLAGILTFISWILFHLARYGMTSWEAVLNLVLITFINLVELTFFFFIFKFLLGWLLNKFEGRKDG